MPRKVNHLDRPLPSGYPQRIKIKIDDKHFTLGWHRRSGKYRLRYPGPDGKEKTALFGPEPSVAEDDALRDGPRLLAGEPLVTVAEPVKKRRKRGERPSEISVRCFNHDYTLKLDTYGQYKGWANGGYVYAGSDPDDAPTIFQDKLMERMFPEVAEQRKEVTLRSALDEWLAVRSTDISVGCANSYTSKANSLCRCAGRMATIPLEAWGIEDWRKLRTELAKIHPLGYTDDSYVLRETLKRATQRHAIITIDGQDVFRSRRKRTRQEKKRKHFTDTEIHALLKIADPQFRVMVLWACNGGFEPLECARLRWEEIHREQEWFEKPRNKTGVMRRFWIWPETREALQEWGVKTSGWVFRNKDGRPWFNGPEDNQRPSMNDSFRELCEEAGVYRKGHGMYALRHFFGHYGSRMGNNFKFSQDTVMGHKTRDTGRIYQGRVDDGFVRARCEYVRLWLFKGEQAVVEYMKRWLTTPEARELYHSEMAWTEQPAAS